MPLPDEQDPPPPQQQQQQEQEQEPALTSAQLHTALKTSLPSLTHLTIQDTSGGCGTSFSATLVSPVFGGKTTLARHRLVNGALRDEMPRIHAWSVRCFTPGEWEGREEGGGR
ncbi:MAG: hypothetical protein M1813_005774 [Trichoglossum hirsutum]|nr:MAG: hypothetical protein M1813_005774 [Trichoglossum hirsutum]